MVQFPIILHMCTTDPSFFHVCYSKFLYSDFNVHCHLPAGLAVVEFVAPCSKTDMCLNTCVSVCPSVCLCVSPPPSQINHNKPKVLREIQTQFSLEVKMFYAAVFHGSQRFGNRNKEISQMWLGH